MPSDFVEINVDDFHNFMTDLGFICEPSAKLNELIYRRNITKDESILVRAYLSISSKKCRRAVIRVIVRHEKSGLFYTMRYNGTRTM